MTDKPTIYDEPSSVRAADGAVEIDGPDAVNVALTPDAAEETSDRLLSASFEARGKKRLDKLPHRPRD
jgi:hypothetical protein